MKRKNLNKLKKSQLIKEYKKLQKRLKEAELMKSEFVKIASHRLYTPLTSIKWYLETLMHKKLDSKQSHHRMSFLKQIYKANQSMIDLIENMLRVCRIEEGRIEIKPRSIQLEELIDKAVKKLKREIKEKNIKVDWKKPKNKYPKVFIDPDKIFQVLLNILDNAIVYNFAGGKIIIKLKKTRKDLICSIKDTGIGIPKKEVKNLFTLFYRGKNLPPELSGNGLDLYVAKAYVKSHRGKIWAESKEGKGTIFYFTLPIQK